MKMAQFTERGFPLSGKPWQWPLSQAVQWQWEELITLPRKKKDNFPGGCCLGYSPTTDAPSHSVDVLSAVVKYPSSPVISTPGPSMPPSADVAGRAQSHTASQNEFPQDLLPINSHRLHRSSIQNIGEWNCIVLAFPFVANAYFAIESQSYIGE